MTFDKSPQSKSVCTVQIRWLIRRDHKEVLDIEKKSFVFPWDEDDLLTVLRQRKTIGMVAEYNHEVIGYMVYSLYPEQITLENFAVDERYRRKRVGFQLIQRLIDKLSQQRRRKIVLDIHETNLIGQKFFRSQCFIAKYVNREYFVEDKRDSYYMEYSLSETFQFKNRIKRHAA